MQKHVAKLMVTALFLTLLAGAAFAQAKPEKKKGKRPSTSGELSSITKDAVAFKDRGGEEVSYPLTDKTAFATLKPLKIEDIKEVKWAVVLGRVADDKASVEARNIIIAAKAPEKPEPVVDARRVTGMLTVAGGQITLKSGTQTLSVVTAESTKVFAENPIKREEVKGNVMVDVKVADDGAKTTFAVYVLPPADEAGAAKAPEAAKPVEMPKAPKAEKKADQKK